MDIKNTSRFVLFTGILVVSMIIIIVVFSRHPMGADFTKYTIISGEMTSQLDSLEGQRVALQGVVNASDPEELIEIGEEKNTIGFIEKQTSPNKDEETSVRYLNAGIIDFTITVNDKKIPAKGQPQQIIDPRNRKANPIDRSVFIDTIKEGEEYSIFGTIRRTGTGEIILEPYRVTSQDITAVVEQAEKANRSQTFVQYLSIFAVLATYGAAILKGGVLGKIEEEENSQDQEESQQE